MYFILTLTKLNSCYFETFVNKFREKVKVRFFFLLGDAFVCVPIDKMTEVPVVV